MERLTAREESGHAYYPHCFREDTCGGGGCAEYSGICEFLEKVCETLAAYEDTNLTPEQILEIDKDYRELCEKLNKYQKLEEDGLLLRLPCKVGDTVYRLIPKTYRKIEPLKVKEFVVCGKGLCFVSEKANFHYSCEEFGEFIFLTQAEAEQALKRLESES